MPVLAAVLTLPECPTTRATVRLALASEPGVTVGPEQPGARVPLVLESDSRAQDRALWQRLLDLPGAPHLELVSADFSDLDASHEAPPPPPRSASAGSPS